MAAIVLAVGLIGHGAMAAAMASPPMTVTAMALETMPDDCRGCPAGDGMDVVAGGCYAACVGSVSGVSVIQVELGRIPAGAFDVPLSAPDRLGRLIPPDPGPPR